METVDPRPDALAATVARALAEDHAAADATSLAVVPAEAQAKAEVLVRADGILAGRAYAAETLRQCDPELIQEWFADDGEAVHPGQTVLQVRGAARAILAAERCLLNFLQQLSGVATATAIAVRRAGDMAVLDTRKTVPGLRDAQKEAVVAGGGRNHRRDLEDQLLLKENHFALSGLDYAETVRRARAAAAGKVVGAESQTLDEARLALAAGADYVLLDNFRGEELTAAVRRLRAEFPDAVLEASGGIGLAQLPQVAACGVDRVSMGALTHSVPSLDLSLMLEPLP
ncbi:MAG: carboxylating nicotinate-nucleotide diphosphorylase [Planctomycetota bacterium]